MQPAKPVSLLSMTAIGLVTPETPSWVAFTVKFVWQGSGAQSTASTVTVPLKQYK